MKPIVIIGVGNYLMGDEGVGIHATQHLRTVALPENVDVIDAGVPSLALLHMIEGRRLTIVIDCADFGGAPGEIKAFTPDKIKRSRAEPQASLHAADLLTTLDIAAQTGLPIPPLWIVGIQPAHIAMTMELSEEARAALEKLPDMVRELIKNHGDSSLH